jgi:protease IV
MSLTGDSAADRRRLKRRLTFWRVAAILLAVAAVGAAFGLGADRPGRSPQAHLARITVSGLIVEDQRREELIAELAEDKSVSAILVRIDSPGGTMVGGESLYLSLREAARQKPVVAIMGTLATSAAYMTALASDWIVAREGTITGSIGVIMQSVTVTDMLDKIGVKPVSVKSSPLKAAPNPLEPFTPESRRAVEALIGDMFQLFVDMVAERRTLSREAALALADGRVFTGRQAKQNGLIDMTGGEVEARKWLADVRSVPFDLPVVDARPRKSYDYWLDLIEDLPGKSLFSERLTLDGLMSVWHPDLR